MSLITKNDFSIKSSNFDLRNGYNIIRIISGLAMFPHFLSKFAGGGLNPGTVGFFAKAGYAPPELWLIAAAAGELIAGIFLVLGIATRWSALLAAGVLLVAAGTLVKVNGFGWTWNSGGIEYPVFWALTCVSIALIEFRKQHN